ncbi:hypothetical protein ACHAW5_002832 [Stephanodiscus triporus]|uniref:Matrin-type domain-containing protein n=1 Tax=Stephanodiscus triporus TaxID=2934178 RepID=A0ABD3PY63_9STRA
MTSSYARQAKGAGGNEPWRNKERHYCALCNAWMGSDRQSIMLHENGKRHREAAENDLARRRDDRTRKEKDRKDLERAYAKMNASAAGAGLAAGVVVPATFGPTRPWDRPPHGLPSSSRGGGIASSGIVAEAEEAAIPSAPSSSSAKEESSRAQGGGWGWGGGGGGDKATSEGGEAPTTTIKPAAAFDPNVVGHYDLEGTTYLEGQVYSEILEEGMPIQLWMGSALATDAEKRDLRNSNNWKMALLAKVVRRRKGGGKETNTNTSCHVSYLQRSTDDDETIESNVPPSRIRLVLGSDPSIPSTMEEAHLALVGGEQTIVVSKDTTADTSADVIDENTGLSGWTTTTIRRVASSFYEKDQEKKRKREHEKELSEYKERRERDMQARKMEEARYANAHDSALGAYDVWSSSSTSAAEGGRTTRSYKGVDITKETKVEVADTARSLSRGMGSVAFKKKSSKKKSVRMTSADDD